MFKKAAIFTDLHLGAKGNSRVHNDDCMDFVDWFIETAQTAGCETGIFTGDFHHNRNHLNVSTMNYSVRILEKLGAGFEQFFFLTGNHDLFYKDRRDIHSVEYGMHIPGITMITDIMERDGVALVPWLIGDEWKRVRKLKSPIVFGHFELPNFYMNALVRMPDTGPLKATHFSKQKYVFSGHFHKRQQQGKIHYIGNAFPHNYADADDVDRGMMVFDMENDLKPEYINWTDCPRYKNVTLSELLKDTDNILSEKMHLRVTIDVDISYEEAAFIKENFSSRCREIVLVSPRQQEDVKSNMDITHFESVDQIVTEEITNLDSGNFDKHTLLDIYNQL